VQSFSGGVGMEVKWIQLKTAFFEDDKTDFIMSLPEADSVIVIWMRILTLAGKCNAGGFILLTENIPYTMEMLAHKTRKPINTVKMALEVLTRLEMLSQDDQGRFFVTSWAEEQNVDALNRLRENGKNRVARHRENKKLTCNVTSNVTETENEQKTEPSNVTVTPLDIDIELDKERDTFIVPTDGGTADGKRKKYTLEHIKLAGYLRKKILEHKPDAKIPTSLDQWANTIRLMVEQDGRMIALIYLVIDFCQTDPFWQRNILSADSLRKQFDRLEMQMRGDKCGTRQKSPAKSTDSLTARLVERSKGRFEAEWDQRPG
jgi:predicted phage replisome organizer